MTKNKIKSKKIIVEKRRKGKYNNKESQRKSKTKINNKIKRKGESKLVKELTEQKYESIRHNRRIYQRTI